MKISPITTYRNLTFGQKNASRRKKEIKETGYFPLLSWSNFDYIIQKTNFGEKIAKYGNNGIPLLYSRNEYIDDLDGFLNTLSNGKRQEILKKLSIEPLYDKNDKMVGYDGLLSPENLDIEDESENKIYKMTHKFLYKNKSMTMLYNLDKVINTILVAYPEFINVIGKKQNQGHAYSVDIHSLEVLIYMIKNPIYKDLSEQQKEEIRCLAIFHDLGKKEGARDPQHPDTSADYFKDISDRMFIPIETREKITNQIKNHYWSGKFQRSQITKQQVADIFKTSDEFEIAKMMTAADIIGCGNSEYFKYLDNLKYHKIKGINQILSAESKCANPSEHFNGTDSRRVP